MVKSLDKSLFSYLKRKFGKSIVEINLQAIDKYEHEKIAPTKRQQSKRQESTRQSNVRSIRYIKWKGAHSRFNININNYQSFHVRPLGG